MKSDGYIADSDQQHGKHHLDLQHFTGENYELPHSYQENNEPNYIDAFTDTNHLSSDDNETKELECKNRVLLLLDDLVAFPIISYDNNNLKNV